MIHNGLTCKELVELVTDYLDGALGADHQRRFEGHLAGCGGCRRHLAGFRETIRLTGRLTGEAIDPSTRDSLLRDFRAWKLVSVPSRPPPGRRGA